MNAIVGQYRRDNRNDHDDAEFLRELAGHANDPDFDESRLRDITRQMIAGRKYSGTEESVVRRIVGKFKSDPVSVSRALGDEDLFRDDLQSMVLRDIQYLLASVGVPTDQGAAPSPVGAVNVEIDPPSYSDLDEHIP